MQAQQHRPGQGELAALAQQHVQRGDRQRSKPEAFKPALRQRPLQLHRHRAGLLGTDGGDHAERLLAKPAQREPQHPGRGRIQPLQVVDGYDRGGWAAGQRKGGPYGQGDRQLVDRGLLRVGAAQRDLQGSPLGGGQLGQGRVQDPLEQVAQRGERQPRLGLGPAGG